MFRLSNSAGFKAEKVVCPNPQIGFDCPLKILVEVWVNGGTPLCCFDTRELYPLLAEDLPIHIPLIMGEVSTTNWIFFCRRGIPRNDSKANENTEKNSDKTKNKYGKKPSSSFHIRLLYLKSLADNFHCSTEQMRLQNDYFLPYGQYSKQM